MLQGEEYEGLVVYTMVYGRKSYPPPPDPVTDLRIGQGASLSEVIGTGGSIIIKLKSAKFSLFSMILERILFGLGSAVGILVLVWTHAPQRAEIIGWQSLGRRAFQSNLHHFCLQGAHLYR